MRIHSGLHIYFFCSLLSCFGSLFYDHYLILYHVSAVPLVDWLFLRHAYDLLSCCSSHLNHTVFGTSIPDTSRERYHDFWHDNTVELNPQIVDDR